MAYVYRHIRLDKNEPFYIGISKDAYRPFTKKGRNKYYLVDNKLYKINKNKSQGEFYSDYDDKNVEVKPKRVIKKTSIIKPDNKTL